MSQYAQDTEVSPEKSRAEIERTLTRYGASAFASGWEGSRAFIGFKMADRQIRFIVPLPEEGEEQFRYVRTGQYGKRQRTAKERQAAWEKALRSRWRAILLVIKAKCEAVASGIVTLDQEWLPYIVLPTGRTVGDTAIPAIQHAYATGELRPLLPGLEEPPLALPAGGGR